ncbi:MAG: NAD(P)/FAD-dependent oxidoreductase [Actinomycetota bacterium]|nr:NAD(P)/FAD-dependent oxidoreductase [Actinomycetota bacterium]MDD5667380.1 NAD(P)/FAD-dependent oxidoreductase [Actinomycetota bacterium]
MSVREVDVTIVGAGTSGTYLAWRLAEAGYRCLVLEKDELENLGTRIGPFHMEEEAFERFGIPLPEGEELLHRLETITMWSPDHRNRATARFATLDMDKPAFMRRLHSYARKAGAEILEKVEFRRVIREKGFPAGVEASGSEGDIEVTCRLVVDASGIDGAVRTSLPDSPWIENDPIADLDTLIVYMESWGDLQGEVGADINSFLHFQGWYAPSYGDELIVGVGMPASPEGARKRQQAFAATLPFTGRAVSSTGGRVPYRRPPLSLLDSGLMVVGDAAFLNKPFNGEGVTSAFTACAIAAEVAADALARDDLTREALWPYNARYFRDQGAKFAFLAAAMPAVVSLSQEEIDFLFTVPGIFSEEGTRALNLEYELKSDPATALRSLPALLAGIATGKLRPGSVAAIVKMGMTAATLRKLYEAYPEHPVAFGAWAEKVKPLWEKADAARHGYFRRLLREYE